MATGAYCTEFEGLTPTTVTATSRDFVGFGPPLGHLTAEATDDFEEQIAIIAVRDARKRSQMALSYDLLGYKCVCCPPERVGVVRSSLEHARQRFTVVTDDFDLVLKTRLLEDGRRPSVPIHALVERGEVYDQVHAESLGVDELVEPPTQITEAIVEVE